MVECTSQALQHAGEPVCYIEETRYFQVPQASGASFNEHFEELLQMRISCPPGCLQFAADDGPGLYTPR